MVKVSLELSYGMVVNSSLVVETEELSLQTQTPWNKRMLLILDGYQEQLIASTTKSSSLDWEMDLLLRPISVQVKWLLSCKVTTMEKSGVSIWTMHSFTLQEMITKLRSGIPMKENVLEPQWSMNKSGKPEEIERVPWEVIQIARVQEL